MQTSKRWVAAIVALLVLSISDHSLGGVNVNARFLFLDQSKRSIPLTVTNPGNDVIEVWLDVKFGYTISDDTGKPTIVYDTLGTPPSSAVPWVKLYPQRFRLEPMGSQVVRLSANPPPNISDGEYWARILIASQSAKRPTSSAEKPKTGMIIVQRIGLPFHYRKGDVTTGLDVQNFGVELTDGAIKVNSDLTRKGNSSFWGVATFRLYDEQRRRLIDVTKDVVVYTTFNSVVSFSRKDIPAGTYTLEVEYRTDGRRDVRKTDLVQCTPIKLSRSVTIH